MEDSGKNQNAGSKRKMLVISRRRRLMILVAVVVTVVVLFLTYWEKEKEKEISATGRDEEKQEVPLFNVKGVTLSGWNEDGEKSWKVEADSGVHFSDRMVLKEVRFYLLDGAEFVSEGETREVIVDRSSNLILREDIVLVSHLNGTQLFTSEMKWITSERKLVTAEKFLIKRTNIIVEGQGLTAAPDLSQIEIKSEAVTRFVESN